MTEFFLYENLTWPEVADLPRDTPLLIPLGEGYPLEILAGALGNPPGAGLLPALPFGWGSSCLPAPEALFAVYVRNLQIAIAEKISHVEEIHEQHTRRTERRQRAG